MPLASIAVGILANFCLHWYRFYLYGRDTDYPQFHSLQRLQYSLFWATIAVMIGGAAWFARVGITRRRAK